MLVFQTERGQRIEKLTEELQDALRSKNRCEKRLCYCRKLLADLVSVMIDLLYGVQGRNYEAEVMSARLCVARCEDFLSVSKRLEVPRAGGPDG